MGVGPQSPRNPDPGLPKHKGTLSPEAVTQAPSGGPQTPLFPEPEQPSWTLPWRDGAGRAMGGGTASPCPASQLSPLFTERVLGPLLTRTALQAQY